MKRIFLTLLRSAVTGIMCGVFFGFIGGVIAYWVAEEKAQYMHPVEAGTYLCAAGNAPIGLAILGVPAGAFIGLSIAGLMLLFKADAGGERLP